MKKSYRYIFVLSYIMMSLFVLPFNVYASSNADEEIEELPTEEEFEFHTVNMDGSIDTVYVEDGHRTQDTLLNPLLRGIGGISPYSMPRDVTNGVVNFKIKACNYTTSYTEETTGRAGYTNGCSGADAAYLGMVNGKVRFMQSGVIGLVSPSEVEVLNYDDVSEVKSVNFYRVEQGRIKHYITTDLSRNTYAASLDFGPKQSYMQNNTVYYSYDGHYFYLTYASMIADYKNNTRKNSINPNNPYYNYYQYLSQRTKTSISAAEFDTTTRDTANNSSSKMIGLGSAFIDAQNTFGANALLNYSLAANESAWGNSNMAQQKNNLFGHKAYDSDPDASTLYKTPADCVRAHAEYFVSINYMDPKDAFGNYNGPHFGDKQNGFNVRYASDPYWGEKMAAIAYAVDRATGGKDYGRYKIGIVDADAVMVRAEPNTSSAAFYPTNTPGNVPILILDEVQGTSVNGNTTWYKIQSDAPLNDKRTAIIQDVGNYNFNADYGYISGAYVKIANEERVPEGGYKKGDVNGDGKITPADYVRIKNHIMGSSKLSGASLIAADLNGDGKITPADYVKVKNIIMGK